MKEVNIK